VGGVFSLFRRLNLFRLTNIATSHHGWDLHWRPSWRPYAVRDCRSWKRFDSSRRSTKKPLHTVYLDIVHTLQTVPLDQLFDSSCLVERCITNDKLTTLGLQWSSATCSCNQTHVRVLLLQSRRGCRTPRNCSLAKPLVSMRQGIDSQSLHWIQTVGNTAPPGMYVLPYLGVVNALTPTRSSALPSSKAR
jgi:hypothetical protein